MPQSLQSPDVLKLLKDAQMGRNKYTPSPEDWRDHWIYFLMTDRFNNPDAPPRAPQGTVQIVQLYGETTNGPTRVINVDLLLGEVQIWSKGLLG